MQISKLEIEVLLDIFKKIAYVQKKNSSLIESNLKLRRLNRKLKILGKKRSWLKLENYQSYFDLLKEIEYSKDFEVFSSRDNIKISLTVIRPLLINENNSKFMIFCHGITNNRWSLFYVIFLVLQRGYSVLTYDARNHGISEGISTTLGQDEACDLQDIIVWLKKEYAVTKIGLYGFSMGAATCLFWIGFFSGILNHEVKLVICEAPFDYFIKQRDHLLGQKNLLYHFKSLMLKWALSRNLKTEIKILEKINPFLSLPEVLPLKLLLLHGLEDSVINWRASRDIYEQLKRNKLNRDKVNLYLCVGSDHGDFSFISDLIKGSLRWKDKKIRSKFTFRQMLYKYLEKNL